MKAAATARRPMILANENILLDVSDALMDGMKGIGRCRTQMRLSKDPRSVGCWRAWWFDRDYWFEELGEKLRLPKRIREYIVEGASHLISGLGATASSTVFSLCPCAIWQLQADLICSLRLVNCPNCWFPSYATCRPRAAFP
jgi:hypothetical protein